MKQTDEREHHDRKHQRELKQIDGAVLQRPGKEMETSMESRETQELDRRQKAADAQQTGEHVLHIRHLAEVDKLVATRLTKHFADLRHLHPRPHGNRHTRPRASDQRPLHVRPEQAKIGSFHPDHLDDFGHHQINDEREMEQGARIVERRSESEELRVKGKGLETTVPENTAVGQELGCESDGGELLGVGIVETELDENGACLLIDPRESAEKSEILSDVGKSTTELVHETRTFVGGMIADVCPRIEFLARLIGKGVADGRCERKARR